MQTVIVRPMRAADAKAASTTLVASIGELCAADHRNDPDVIRAWTANKTPNAIRRWIGNPRTVLVLADIEGACAGVGGLSTDGEMLLNYVHPDHRFRGVSRAILCDLERRLAGFGHAEARLTGTATALPFYRSAGWRETGALESGFGIDGFVMAKALRRGA